MESKYLNGSLKLDSTSFHYNSTGQLEKADHYFRDYTGLHFIEADKLMFDSQGNILKKLIDPNPFFYSYNSFEYEYDYSKKAPITIDIEIATLFDDIPRIFISYNLLKKIVYNDSFNSPSIYLLNTVSSVFNSYSRPLQLSFEQSGGGLNYTDKNFFIYE